MPEAPSRWRPRHRQHRLVQLLLMRKCTRRPIIASLLSTTLLSAMSVAPVSFTIHAPPTNLTYVVDAAQVSTSLRSRGPVAQSLKLVLLGWSAKVDLQPNLDCDAAIKYISEYASEPETVSVGYQPRLGRLLRPHTPKDAVRRLFARMATADRDITAQKAVYLLLRDHLVDA